MEPIKRTTNGAKRVETGARLYTDGDFRERTDTRGTCGVQRAQVGGPALGRGQDLQATLGDNRTLGLTGNRYVLRFNMGIDATLFGDDDVADGLDAALVDAIDFDDPIAFQVAFHARGGAGGGAAFLERSDPTALVASASMPAMARPRPAET